MIINGGSRSGWKHFAVHLANEKDNERVRLVEVHGLDAKTIKQGFAQLQAMANLAGAGEKEFYYHANVNPEKNEELTEGQWDIASERLKDKLNLDSQPGMTIEHTKGGRTHRHYITLRVDLDTGKLISDSHDYLKHQKTARELEREFGLAKVKGVHVERDGPRPERRPKNWEVRRGQKSGIDPQDVKAEVTARWNECDTGAEVRTAFAQQGYMLCQGNRGANFCIVDAAGNEHSLARRVAGAREKDIRQKLRDIDRDSLPTVEDARAERRGDKKRVQEAVARGGDKSGIERVLNVGRAADVTASHPEETGDSQHTVYERTRARRRIKDDPHPEPQGGKHLRWEERERGRRELERER